MDSSYELLKFLPLVYTDQGLADYISYHAKHLDLSLEHGIESGVFFHTHILYMTFVYIQIWRISQLREKDFKYSWILSGQENEFSKRIVENRGAFSFSILNEKTVFRFFRLLEFDDGFIGSISTCIKERNQIAHASGEPIYDLDKKIEGYINNMEKIIQKSVSFLSEIYEKFLTDNQELCEEGYEIQHYDIEQSFLGLYSISEYDLQVLFADKDKYRDKVSMWIKDVYELQN